MSHEVWIVEWLVAQDNTWMMSAHTSAEGLAPSAKEVARSKMGLLISQWPACQHVIAKEWKP